MSDLLTTSIRTICSWCLALIHDGALVDGRVSHGLCLTCARKLEEEIAR